MDSFELNKIMGAILGTLVFVMGVGFLAEAVYEPVEGAGGGYTLPEPEPGESAATAEAVEATPLPVLLASASADDGASVARKCASCHNFEEGGANKTGPDLYGVVGRPIASHEGFAYSDALLSLGADGQVWTYEMLNEFLTSPKGYVPGTKMTFAGLRSEEDRANLLAYLQTLSHDPVPFPAAEEAPAADEDAAATGSEGAAATEEPAAAGEDEAAPAEAETPAGTEAPAASE